MTTIVKREQGIGGLANNMKILCKIGMIDMLYLYIRGRFHGARNLSLRFQNFNIYNKKGKRMNINQLTDANIGKPAKIRFTAKELCAFLAANYKAGKEKACCHGIPGLAEDAIQEVACKILGAKTGCGRLLTFDEKVKDGVFEFESPKAAITALAWQCRARMGAIALSENYFKAPAEALMTDDDGEDGLSATESIFVNAVSNSYGESERSDPFRIESAYEPTCVDGERERRVRRFNRLQRTLQMEKYDEINPTFADEVDRSELRNRVREVLECVRKEHQIKADNMSAALLMLLWQYSQKEAVLKVWRVADEADLARRCNGLSQIVHRLKGYLRIAFWDDPVVQDFLEAA